MRRVQFKAFGHQNVIGEHKSTVELTSEEHLTRQGTCIIGVGASMTLNKLDSEIKELAKSEATKIILRMNVEGVVEEVLGVFQVEVAGPEITLAIRRKRIEHSLGYLMMHSHFPS